MLVHFQFFLFPVSHYKPPGKMSSLQENVSLDTVYDIKHVLCYFFSLFKLITSLQLSCIHSRSSVGRNFAKTRAMIFAIIGFIFLAAGVGVTVGTLDLARNSGGERKNSGTSK